MYWNALIYNFSIPCLEFLLLWFVHLVSLLWVSKQNENTFMTLGNTKQGAQNLWREFKRLEKAPCFLNELCLAMFAKPRFSMIKCADRVDLPSQHQRGEVKVTNNYYLAAIWCFKMPFPEFLNKCLGEMQNKVERTRLSKKSDYGKQEHWKLHGFPHANRRMFLIFWSILVNESNVINNKPLNQW